MRFKGLFAFVMVFFLVITFAGCNGETTIATTSGTVVTTTVTTATTASDVVTTSTTPATSASTSATTVDTSPQFTVPAVVEIKVGYTYQIEPEDVANVTTFSYLSTDDEIVTVNDEGLVTAVGAGSVVVVVAGGTLNKNITFEVEENLLNGVSITTLKAIASFSADQVNIEKPENSVWNIGWDQATEAATAGKMDFAGTSVPTDVILRGYSSAEKYSVLENGHYVIVMIGGANPDMTEATTPEGVHASVYGKLTVPERANHFRLWAWSNKDSVVSGRGSFRVVAYTLNQDELSYTAIPLTARDSGSLVQDENGWITFVDCQTNNQIVDAPADNMFIYEVATNDYDIKGEEVILFVEFKASANTLGAENANMQDRFGIKRMGFINDPDPNFTIDNGASAEIIVGDDLQIELSEVGGVNPDNYTYESSNTSVATVSLSGLIESVAIGTATITVTNGTLIKSIEIEVVPVPASSFDLESSHTLLVGDPYQVVPTNVVQIDSFTFVSNNEQVATVSTDGTVTTHASGIAVITVAGGDISKQQTLIVNTTSMFGLNNTDLQNMATFTADEVDIEVTGGNVINFVPSWGATGLNADKIDLDGSSLLTDKVLRTIHSLETLKSVINIETNWFEMINGVGMNETNEPTSTPHAVVYFKTIVPDKGNFRVWIYSSALGDPISGHCTFRVSFYVPNDDYTQFTAVPLLKNFQENPSITINDLGNGYYEYENGADMFLAFTVPDNLKGEEVFVAIETIGTVNVNNYQDRMAVKRMGFLN